MSLLLLFGNSTGAPPPPPPAPIIDHRGADGQTDVPPPILALPSTVRTTASIRLSYTLTVASKVIGDSEDDILALLS